MDKVVRIRRHTNHIRGKGSCANNRGKEELCFSKPNSLTREDNELTEDNGEDIILTEPENNMSHPVLTDNPLPSVRRSSRMTRKPLRLDL